VQFIEIRFAEGAEAKPFVQGEQTQFTGTAGNPLAYQQNTREQRVQKI